MLPCPRPIVGATIVLLAMGGPPAAAERPSESPPKIDGFRDRAHAAESGCTMHELDGRRAKSCVLVESVGGFDVLRIYDARDDGRFVYADWVCAASGGWKLVDLMGTGRKAFVAILDALPVAQGEQKKVMAGVVLAETGPHAIFSEPLSFARSASLGCGAQLRGDVRVEAKSTASVLHVAYEYRDCTGYSLKWDEALPWDRATTSFYANASQVELAANADQALRRNIARSRLRVPFADAHDLCGTFLGEVGLRDLFKRG